MRIRYGLSWADTDTDLDIELFMIKHRGRYQGGGLGLYAHMMKARALCWPERYTHFWTELMYREFIQNDITILMGCASSQKTSHASEYVLLKYFASPENTLVILSTVDTDKLDTGVWAEVKMLWEKARKLHPDLPGNLIEHRRTITTDSLDAGDVRDLRRGILSRPCYVGAQWVGLGKLVGTKQENVIFLADELQFMAPTFIESWANLFSNPFMQIIGSGNPNHDPEDQLGKAAEPKDGWASIGEPQVTTVWETRYMGGRCVNLVGQDSPNFRAAAEGRGEPYARLIGPKYARRIASDWGLDSPKYYSQVKGVMKIGMLADRVITRQVCREFHAMDKAVWAGTSALKRVHGLDPSYGGRDSAISTILEWGRTVDGSVKLRTVFRKEHRFNLNIGKSVEIQLAEQVKELLTQYGIPPENSFYDPYGKGTMGFAFAQIFGSNCPIPIDSGGRPTERPVRQDLYVQEKDGFKRLKKCSEHYSKFVSEAWFSVRYVIEADQMRELPEQVMDEMCGRKYAVVAGDKIEVEPKDDLIERTGRSPNNGDSMAIAVDGARQRGFQIGRIGSKIDNAEGDPYQWLADKRRDVEKLLASKRLTHA